MSAVSDFVFFPTALDISFGSLYSDEVDVNILREHVIPTLAAARLLDLSGLLTVCQDVMMETLNASTVCKYHQAASTYALLEVEKKYVSFLLLFELLNVCSGCLL